MKGFGVAVVSAFLLVGGANASRQMENLDRGLVAVKVSGGVYLSWRLFGTDLSSTVAFNLYRDGKLVNASPITGATNYTDAAGTSSSKYEVRPVIAGVEKSADKTVSVWSSQKLVINLDRPAGGSNSSGSYTYSPNDIAVGDLDGDGEYELVLKWDPSNSQDNSKAGYTGNVFIDAYKLNGKKLWRIDLGVNIRAGAHYTQMLVGDYDSDGYAEVALKTAPGTKDGLGKYISKGAAAGETGHKTDYRNSKGYVLSGNEYLTIFNGQTGAEMATVAYNPSRGKVSDWGDSYGNRVDRFLATNAYLDGVKPSMVFQRGYYTRMALSAYDWDGTNLTQRWYYNAASKGQECYGQGNHNLSAGDVDGDGFDEIIEGNCAIDHNGKFMYRVGYGHGDAIHFGDLVPDRPGLEVWEVHEEKPYGYNLHDAKTGKVIFYETSSSDNGRGLSADVDNTSRGYEFWSAANWNTYNSNGTAIASSRPAYNFRIYWDGDPYDELLDNTTISKWNSSTKKSSNLITFEGNSCNSTKATPNISADILGDWREEVILHNGSNQLYLYTTTIPTEKRMYTLMHDPIYRLGISWQNTAYNQPPHLGFWLANDKDSIPVPDIELVGSVTVPTLIKQGAGSSNQQVLWTEAIEAFSYAYKGCSGAKVEGLPEGITAKIADGTVAISGTPTETGTFPFTVTTYGGEGDAAVKTGSITVIPKAMTSTTGEILSWVNAAYPTDGYGGYEESNAGWIDSGYYNFVNDLTGFGEWKLLSEKTAGNANLTIRFANGGSADRMMNLVFNDSTIGAVSFPSTGNWTTYDSVVIPVVLQKGLNTIALYSMMSDGGPNVDEFEFDAEGVRQWTIEDTSWVNQNLKGEEESEEEKKEDSESEALMIQGMSSAQAAALSASRNGISYRIPVARASLAVFDANGNVVLKQIVGRQGVIVQEWDALPAGNYIIGIRANGKFLTQISTTKK